MSQFSEIVLPAGTHTVAVGDIPRLLALALYPERPESPYILKCITKVILSNSPLRDTPPCNSEELRLVTEIAGVPPHDGQHISKGELEAYLTRFNTSPNRPKWNIGASVINQTLESDMNRVSAEAEHRAALKIAIRNGSFVPLSHARLPLHESIREALDLGQVSIETLREYAQKFGISVRIDRETIQAFADRISEATAERHRGKRQHATDPDPIHRTIVAAMSAHGWPADGIPGVLDFIYKEIESGRLEVFSAFNELPCTDVSVVRINPAQWFLTSDGESHILDAITSAVERAQDPHRREKRIAELDVLKDGETDVLESHSVQSIHYNNSSEPIWEQWAEYTKLTARQAVLLMHGLNPKAHPPEGEVSPPHRLKNSAKARRFFTNCWHRIEVSEAAELGNLTPAEWLKWATGYNWPVCKEFREIAHPGAAQTSTHVMLPGEPKWLAIARKEYLRLANEPRNHEPTQLDICRKVEAALREQGVTGPHKRPLAAETIKKEAITGKWWRKHFKQKTNSQGKGEIEQGK